MQYDTKNMVQRMGAAFLLKAAWATEVNEFGRKYRKAKAQRKKRPDPLDMEIKVSGYITQLQRLEAF